jgi:hypothetical protein
MGLNIRRPALRPVDALIGPPSDPWKLVAALGPAALVALLITLLAGRFAQPAGYHQFHDARTLLGIPNFWNVISNTPFAIVGAASLLWLARGNPAMPQHLRLCYQTLFFGVLLTGLGSSIYHWAPTSATLIWDRLPMAIGFMGLFAGFLTERLQLKPETSRLLLPALLTYGIASVLYWAYTDDLRFYLIAQFYPLAAIPLVLWRTHPTFTRGADWLIALAIYAAAKVFEDIDGTIFALGQILSGHTVKHLLAAAGTYWLYRMLKQRRAIGTIPPRSTRNENERRSNFV